MDPGRHPPEPRPEDRREFISPGDGHQAALAKKCAVTFQFISLIEKGESNPTLDILINVAAALNVEVRALFEPPDGTYQPPRPGRPKNTIPPDENTATSTKKVTEAVKTGSAMSRGS